MGGIAILSIGQPLVGGCSLYTYNIAYLKLCCKGFLWPGIRNPAVPAIIHKSWQNHAYLPFTFPKLGYIILTTKGFIRISDKGKVRHPSLPKPKRAQQRINWENWTVSWQHNMLNRAAGGRALAQSETLTERVVLMVSWNDIFTFVIMMVAILTYIDNHRHKK